jgi:hypothetical protein
MIPEASRDELEWSKETERPDMLLKNVSSFPCSLPNLERETPQRILYLRFVDIASIASDLAPATGVGPILKEPSSAQLMKPPLNGSSIPSSKS